MSDHPKAVEQWQKAIRPLDHKRVTGGGVPGGHNVLVYPETGQTFVPEMGVCNSVPLRHSDTVVDIGAYVGTYAIRCARFPVRKVVAYEASPRTFEVLALTKLPNLEAVHAAVVGDERVTAELYLSSGVGLTNSLVMQKRKGAVVTVPAVSYVEAIAGATVVKIDVEGAEYLYPLNMFPDTVRAFVIDFHKVPSVDYERAAKRLGKILGTYGFERVVEPSFEKGCSFGGSWIRPTDEDPDAPVCEPLMSGRQCCGCGVLLMKATSKALCTDCYLLWSKHDRDSFTVGSAG